MADQEGEEDPAVVVFSDPDDPRRMELTVDERNWALDIKDVIDMYPELDPLSDFMYAHLALVVKDDVAQAVRIALQLQAFREEYDIKDELEASQRCTTYFVQHLQPGVFIDFSFHPAQGGYVLVQDVVKIETVGITQTDQKNAFMAGHYFKFHGLFPDFDAIRRGFTVVIECEGFSYSNNKQNFKLIRAMFSELFAAYPCADGSEVRHMNSPAFWNIMASGLRRFLPPQLRKRFCSGPSYTYDASFDGGRLDALYLTPNMGIAMKRVSKNLNQSLERRFRNEAAFSLSDGDNDVIDEMEFDLGTDGDVSESTHALDEEIM